MEKPATKNDSRREWQVGEGRWEVAKDKLGKPPFDKRSLDCLWSDKEWKPDLNVLTFKVGMFCLEFGCWRWEIEDLGRVMVLLLFLNGDARACL